MAAAPLRLLLVFILLLSGLHNAAPAMAGMTHHATDSHLSHHVEPGHASDKDTQKGQQDADLHGSHHNCPVASDQALSGHDDLPFFSVRKTVVWEKSVSYRVDLVGGRT